MTAETKPTDTTVAANKPGFDAEGNRILKIKPKDSCLIIRPITDGFQTIVFHNFPQDMDAEDKFFYHIMMRGLAEIAVEQTQEVVDAGVEAASQPTLGVRPVDADGNIREDVEPTPLGPVDLNTAKPQGRA